MNSKKIIKDILSITMLSLMALKSTVFAITPSKDIIENSKNLKELISIYRNNPNYSSLSDDDLITMAREDWYEFSKIEAEKAICFDGLPAEEVTIDGITYLLYGFAHGSATYPMPKEYETFVRKTYHIENNRMAQPIEINDILSRSGFILAEQYIPRILNDEDGYFVDIKDHLCEKNDLPTETKETEYGFIVKLIAGYMYSFIMTYSTLDNYLTETTYAVSPRAGKLRTELLEEAYNIETHSMNIEIEEGLKKKLPSHLQTEVILSKTKHKDKLDQEKLEMATIRSLYMAGFLKGFAEKGNYKKVPFFMGRAHLPEVKGFLIDSNNYAKKTQAYQMGQENGSLLAEKILIAQKNGTENVLDVIAAWNPPKASSLETPHLLGYTLGFFIQALLAYKLWGGLYFLCATDAGISEQLLKEFMELSFENQDHVLTSLSPEHKEAFLTELARF